MALTQGVFPRGTSQSGLDAVRLSCGPGRLAKHCLAAPSHMSGPRILIDLTTSLALRGQKPVGIVRTEREIAIRLLSDRSLCTLPFVFRDGEFRALDPAFARRMLREAPSAVPTSPQSARGTGRGNTLRKMTSGVRAVARVGLRAVPGRGREELRLSLIHMRQAIRNLVYGAPHALPFSARGHALQEAPDLSVVIHPGSADVMFTCGLGWDHCPWAEVARLKRETGMRVVCICYDLIPLVFPNFIPGNHDLYLSHFLNMLDVADHIPCISRATEVDLLQCATASGRMRPRASVVTLGADLHSQPDPNGLPPDLASCFSARRFALAVGTFEIRKNYGLLLDIWEALAKDPNFDLDLVVVGAHGWRAEAVIKRFEASPLLGKRVHWLRGLGDPALSWLYEHAHVSLFPSLYEGWGLPVVESLMHGCPVIASNRGSVPEAGFGVATIVDPDDKAAWIEAVRRSALAPRGGVPPMAFPGWDDTAAALTRILLTTASAPSQAKGFI